MEEASGIKRSIYDQLLTRMRDPFVKNKLMVVCSNPDLGWIKDIFVDNIARKDPAHAKHDEYNSFIHTYVWKTELNKHLPPDFIDLISKGKPDWWLQRYLYGSFEHSEGLVYPKFASTLVNSYEYLSHIRIRPEHCDKYGIPKIWERFTTLDHGLRNATAFYLHAINPDTNEVITYAEYYQPNQLVPYHVEQIRPMIASIPYGMLWFMVADPSIRNKTDPINGKSVLALYAEYDIFFTPGNNDVEMGILKVNSYIERGKWKIFRDKCPELVKEGIGYKFKEQTMDNVNENLDERPIKNKDHGLDSIRYGFARLPDSPDLLKLAAYEPSLYKKEAENGRMNEYHWSDEDMDDLGSVASWQNYY